MSDIILRNTKGFALTFDEMDTNIDLLDKHYYISAIDPTSTDDIDNNFKKGYLWTNITTDSKFECKDDTAGNAIWELADFGGSSSLPADYVTTKITVLVSDNWTQKTSASPVLPRESYGIAYYNNGTNNMLLASCGYNSNNDTDYFDTSEYNIDTETWTTVKRMYNRKYNKAISYNDGTNDFMVVYGGYESSSALGELWIYNRQSDSWTQKTANSARYNHSAIFYNNGTNNLMVVYGGYNGSDLSDVWEYNIDTDSWTQKTSSVIGRNSHSAIYYNDGINNLMVVYGGYISSSKTDEVWEYNLDTNVWTQKTSGGVLVASHSAIYYNNGYSDIMVIFGGLTGSGIVNDVWEYNLDTDTWTQKTSGATARSNHNAIVYNEGANNYMIVYGGQGGSSTLDDVWEYRLEMVDGFVGVKSDKIVNQSTRQGSSLTQTLEELPTGNVGTKNVDETNISDKKTIQYDLASDKYILVDPPTNDAIQTEVDALVGFEDTVDLSHSDSWTQKTANSARYNHSAIFYNNGTNNLMVIHGGYDGSVSLSDVWEYNIDTDSWTQKTSSASARDSHSAIFYNNGTNNLMVIFSSTEVWEYNLDTNVWTQKTSGATARSSQNAIFYNNGTNNLMVVYGGTDTGGGWAFTDVWEYNLDTDTWTQKTSGGDVFRFKTAIYYNNGTNNLMVVYGGLDNSNNRRNTLWEYNLDTNTWTQLTSGGAVRYSASATFSINNNNNIMTVFGGNGEYNQLNDVWEYNLDTDTWTQKTSGATIRYMHTAISYSTISEYHMIVYGGESHTGTALGDTYDYESESTLVLLGISTNYIINKSNKTGNTLTEVLNNL